jgi:hypothetical protein
LISFQTGLEIPGQEEPDPKEEAAKAEEENAKGPYWWWSSWQPYLG